MNEKVALIADWRTCWGDVAAVRDLPQAAAVELFKLAEELERTRIQRDLEAFYHSRLPFPALRLAWKPMENEVRKIIQGQ